MFTRIICATVRIFEPYGVQTYSGNSQDFTGVLACRPVLCPKTAADV